MSAVHYPDFFRRPAGPFTAAVLAGAKQWAADFPTVEVCGLVRDGAFVPCENVAAHPEREFEIPTAELAEAYGAGDLQGVIHSHPGGPWWPSKADTASQIEMDVPWAILVPGEGSAALACHWGLPRPPLFHDGQHVPRDFIHYASDCYALLQDYYGALGWKLQDMPRCWEWWKDPDQHGSLYLDNLESQGFEVVTTDPSEIPALVQPHDAYLLAIRSKVPNHGGVYLGDGLVLEHLHGRLSSRQPLARIQKHITHLVRWKGLL